jgi:hypothetical protein
MSFLSFSPLGLRCTERRSGHMINDLRGLGKGRLQVHANVQLINLNVHPAKYYSKKKCTPCQIIEQKACYSREKSSLQNFLLMATKD